MTQAELWEMNFMCIANALTAFSIYLTVAFAYLATAYFVGKKLSGLQAFVVSGLFVFASLSAIGGCMAQLRRASEFQLALSSQSNELMLRPLTNASFWSTYMPLLMLSGVLVSLYFMFDRRRQYDN
jgi:hypothetical protein